MKLKSIVCGSLVVASLFAFSSCVSAKSDSNLDQRRSIAVKTENVVSGISGVKSADAVVTKDMKVRVFVETSTGELSQALIDSIKKEASAKTGVKASDITVFAAVTGPIDEK